MIKRGRVLMPRPLSFSEDSVIKALFSALYLLDYYFQLLYNRFRKKQ